MQAVPVMGGMLAQNPGMNGGHQQQAGMPMSQQHGIPLTQPLVINTSFAGGIMTNSQTMTMTTPVQVNLAGQLVSGWEWSRRNIERELFYLLPVS
jgi:hypothetical protein